MAPTASGVLSASVLHRRSRNAGNSKGYCLRPSPRRFSPRRRNPQSFVNAGSLVSFVSGISSQNQMDVLNSTMLAQIAGADKKFDREQSAVDWLKFYRNILEQVGWVAQEWSWNAFHASGNETDVDKAVSPSSPPSPRKMS